MTDGNVPLAGGDVPIIPAVRPFGNEGRACRVPREDRSGSSGTCETDRMHLPVRPVLVSVVLCLTPKTSKKTNCGEL